MNKQILKKLIFDTKYGRIKETLFCIGLFLLTVIEVVAIGNLTFDVMRWLNILN